MSGDFYTSPKGTKCFKYNKDGQHILIKGDSSMYSKMPNRNGLLYDKLSLSNGGGTGNYYIVVNKDYFYNESETNI